MSADDFLTDPDRACANPAIDPDQFFSASTIQQDQARRVCGWCPVQQACLAYALRRREQFGIWGGVDMTDTGEVATARARMPVQPVEPTRARQVNLSREQIKTRNEEGVRKHWELGKSDLEIGLAVGITFSAVSHIRARLGLAALYGPKGRRLQQAVNA